MKLTEPRLKVFQVSHPDDLPAHLQAIASSDMVGVDAERASGFRYSHRAYLIQLSLKDRILLIDPYELGFDGPWSSELASALSGPLWILHSATQDLPCLAELDLKPSRLFDTELAARLTGAERFGLSSLAESLLSIELEKEHSAADWSKRPLTESMLNYAALDVDILFDLHSSLSSLLREQGKDAWAEQEFRHLLGFRAKPQPIEPWRSLPGMSKIKDKRAQQIGAGLWKRRDEIARERDVAPGRLVPDRSIMAVVSAPPKTKAELAKNKQFHGRASRELLKEWWQAIVESEALEITAPVLDSDHMPNHRNWERRFPDAHIRYTTLRPLVQARAEELNLATEMLLTPDFLRRVCFAPANDFEQQLKDLGARDWQIENVSPVIADGLRLAEAEIRSQAASPSEP